jgi:hypothetical protein
MSKKDGLWTAIPHSPGLLCRAFSPEKYIYLRAPIRSLVLSKGQWGGSTLGMIEMRQQAWLLR